MRPVGLRGEVVVHPTGSDSGRFAKGARLRIEGDPDSELTVRGCRGYRGGIAVRFEGIDTVEAAEALRGTWLWVSAESLPPLAAGIYYHYQVLGLTVVDSEGLVLGRIEAIMEAGANDVYCVGEGPEEILIPAVRDYVERIDLPSGRLFLKVPRANLGLDERPI